MPDYQKTQIYKLFHKDDVDNKNIYIGHSTQIHSRLYNHERNCYNDKVKEYNYKLYKYSYLPHFLLVTYIFHQQINKLCSS